MSTRNMIWLAVIVVVGVVVWVTAGFWWGLLAAAVVLVGSEAVERTARKRRLGDAPAPSVRSAIGTRRKSR